MRREAARVRPGGLSARAGRARDSGGAGRSRPGWVNGTSVRAAVRRNVLTDRALRTGNPHVWAAWDVTSRSRHTHAAGVHAAIAATNAVLGTRRRVSSVAAPSVTFTSPEVAAVGQPTAAGMRRVITVPHSQVDQAVADGQTLGSTRIVLDRAGRSP